MSYDKRNRMEDLVIFPGEQEVEKYVYTPGIHGLEFAKGLKEGKILGMKCKDKIYVPPKTFCPDFTQGELIEINDEWILVSYTIVYQDMYKNNLPNPKIIGVIKPKNAETGLIHLLNVPLDKLEIGIKLKPVFKPENERNGTINDIKYFELS
ncbi:MAG: nucleic acid-binding protein [Caldisphaera sp.]|jgi:uncharacterized OB-fold protein|uniref:Zn-ribbon domain-containing OB-fold protein n=1 Tax=Caldisphaera sp. TaxID=2060322 RepID=UPI000CB761F6|nr:Zn-ribbon domain-containing OB-fold protein [Caldisphaera sp.]PMP87831.1 MAG: nucleic acid-binding protein [Caldisphaera sp.]